MRTKELFLREFENGKTAEVEVWINNKLYLVDIDKNGDSAAIDIYKKLGKNRAGYSKYDPAAERVSFLAEPNALLSEDVLKNRKDIAEMQKTAYKYCYTYPKVK